ncbi:hypothetical protein [Streptomyces sp. NPDC056491]|uniref:hypothetical protein n=1 Tax=Streptomyces sp. NPDC056491 TaxID=3345837 RepID=UPI0036CEAC2D
MHLIIDDRDGRGSVRGLADPAPDHARHESEVRLPDGSGATVPDGPAKGFTIGTGITGAGREGRAG